MQDSLGSQIEKAPKLNPNEQEKIKIEKRTTASESHFEGEVTWPMLQ